jgi:hypothetical protein
MSTEGTGTTRHGGEDAELLELVAALQAEAPGPHPPPAGLLAYRRGELAAADAEPLQDHLAECPACSGVLTDLDAFEGTGPAAGAAGSGEEPDTAAGGGDAAWRTILARLPARQEAGGGGADAAVAGRPARDGAGDGGAEAGATTAAGTARSGRRGVLSFRGRPRAVEPAAAGAPAPRVGRAAWIPWLAAAAMLVLAAGLALEVARLRGAAAAQPNVPLVYLDAATRSETAAGAAGGGAVPVPAAPADGVVVLVVTPEDPAAFAGYELELRSGEGTWTVSGLRPVEPYGTLRAAVPARLLAAAPVSVTLIGVGTAPDGAPPRRELARYRLEPVPR